MSDNVINMNKSNKQPRNPDWLVAVNVRIGMDNGFVAVGAAWKIDDGNIILKLGQSIGPENHIALLKPKELEQS